MTRNLTTSIAKNVARLRNQPSVKRALDFLATLEPELMAQQIAINQIPAPTFQETERAHYLRTQFHQLNLTQVTIDAVGNVIGVWPQIATDNFKMRQGADPSANCDAEGSANCNSSISTSDGAANNGSVAHNHRVLENRRVLANSSIAADGNLGANASIIQNHSVRRTPDARQRNVGQDDCSMSQDKMLPYICLSAHLDTVFPRGTNCHVQARDGRYYGPGISDNASGLVGMLAIARALSATELRLKRPVLFAATVGEEGNGDLCGARHLFTAGRYQQQIKYFISLDGPGAEHIIHRALGSRRYRVTFTGPGGHSWSDFGTVNPAHAIGRLIAKLCAYQLPSVPTSYNVGILEAQGSVNTIPQTATCQVDLRSVSEQALLQLEEYFLAAVSEAAAAEKHFSRAHFLPPHHPTLQITLDQLGCRPSGELAVESPLVQYAVASSRLLGIMPRLECASTDANIPISLGLEAITLGAGGNFAGCHTLNEWYEPHGRIAALQRTLLLICALGGLA